MGMFSRGTGALTRRRTADEAEAHEEHELVSSRVQQAALRAIVQRSGADVGCARDGAARVPVRARVVPEAGGAVTVQVAGVVVARLAPAQAARWRRTHGTRPAEVSAEVYLPAEDEGRSLSIAPVGGW